jgi:hypothetical protein
MKLPLDKESVVIYIRSNIFESALNSVHNSHVQHVLADVLLLIIKRDDHRRYTRDTSAMFTNNRENDLTWHH